MNLLEAQAITGYLSAPSKMPGFAFAISAKRCLTGRELHKIEGSICSKCYALRGRYTLPNVLIALDKRLEAIKHPQWVEAMTYHIKVLETSRYFRWMSSGDLQNLGMLIKIVEVCRRTPSIKHWLSTREIGILNAFHNAGFTYPSNLVVRYTAPMIEQKPSKDILNRLNIQGSAVSKVRWNCPSSEQDNRCQDCRKCWHKSVPVVTYKYH